MTVWVVPQHFGGSGGIVFLGPFFGPRAENRYIIVAVHYLAKTRACSVGDARTAQLMNFLESHIMFRRVSPCVLISDRGTTLMSS